MSLFPVLTIILPLLGAGATLGLSCVRRVRPYARYIALMAVISTTVLILAFRWMEPQVVIPSLWQPSLLFGTALALQSYTGIHPLALALALVTCSAVFVEVGRAHGPGRSPQEEALPQLAATVLALLAAAFVALWAANVLTMIISWAIYDLLLAVGRVAAGGTVRMAIRGLILGSLATLLLWVGTLLPDGGAGGELWSLMTLSDAQLTLWAAASILRLWVYPFHLSAPHDLDLAKTSPLAAPLLMAPVIGWGLWFHLTIVNGGFIPGDAWVPILAPVTMALGSFLAWSCESPRRLLPWVGMGTTGAVLLAAGLAGENAAAVITAGSVGWALGMAVLFLPLPVKRGQGDVLQRESPWWKLWNIPPLVGALTLLGMPLTLGFVTGATLVGGLMQTSQRGHLGWGSAFFLLNLFLVPSLVRWLRTRPSFSPVQSGWRRRWMALACGVGLGLPMLLLIAAGLHPSLLVRPAEPDEVAQVLLPSLHVLSAMPGLVGSLVWVVSLTCGGLLAWQQDALRPRMELLFGPLHDLLRLDWLYDVVVGAFDRGLGLVRATDEVVGGAGALLWSLLIFLLLLLLWGSI